MAHRIVTEASRWDVMRKGGWARSASGTYVTFAQIHANVAGCYEVTYSSLDDRVSSAALDLGVLGRTYDSHLDASRDAHKAVALALEIEWAREDAEEAVRTKHGVES